MLATPPPPPPLSEPPAISTAPQPPPATTADGATLGSGVTTLVKDSTTTPQEGIPAERERAGLEVKEASGVLDSTTPERLEPSSSDVKQGSEGLDSTTPDRLHPSRVDGIDSSEVLGTNLPESVPSAEPRPPSPSPKEPSEVLAPRPLSPTATTSSPLPSSDAAPVGLTNPPEVASPPTSSPTHPPLHPLVAPEAPFTRNGVLPPELFDVPLPSPLFPSPSSSFRPPPSLDADPDLTDRLDARIASSTKRASAVPPAPAEESITEGEEKEVFAVPAIPVPRKEKDSNAPPSRPPSAHLIRRRAPSSASLTRTTSSSTHATSPLVPQSEGGDIWSAPALLSSTSIAVLGEVVVEVIVRDFAFARDDPRFRGEPGVEVEGSLGGGSSKRGSERFSGSPAVGNEAFATSGSSAFSWGFVTSHQTDFPSGGEEDDSQLYSVDGEEIDGEDDEPEGPFVPGIYSAVYDFESELESEMTIAKDDFVTVYRRECKGWVQAVRMDGLEQTSEVGLVPENYLVLVERINDALGRDEAAIDWGEEEEEDEQGCGGGASAAGREATPFADGEAAAEKGGS